MTPDNDSLASPAHDRDDEDTEILDRVVAEYVDRLNSGERIDHLEIMASHPDEGEQILRELEVFVDLEAGVREPVSLGTVGDYTLRRQIGRGGMGVVYEAWEGSMDRVVALKVLPPGVAADNKAFVRFMREAKTAGKLWGKTPG